MPISDTLASLIAAPATRAILLMATSGAVISFMHTGVRHMGADLHPFMIAFFRNLFTLILMAPFLLRAGPDAWKTKRPGLQAARGAVGVGAMLIWFYALTVLPLSESISLSFTSTIFLTMGAAVILGERVGVRRWVAVAVGFLGVVIVLRPGFQEIGIGAIAAIFSSLLWAVSLLMMKVLSRDDSNITIVFYASLYLTPLSLPAALWYWQTPTTEQFLMLIGMAGCSTIAHLCLTQAFRLADASAVMPIDYLRLIWVSALAFLLFGEVPEPLTWIGGSIIFASTLYITFRESQLAREKKAAEALAQG